MCSHSSHSHSPDITVIVAAYMSRSHIDSALRSLANQTLDKNKFETLVVINGPDDGTNERVEQLRKQLAPMTIRVIRTPLSGASRAYNLGIDFARGKYITFVDDDDTVSETYLERLLEVAATDTVVMAPFADVSEKHPTPSFDNYLNRAAFRFAGLKTTLGALPQAAAANCGKLVARGAVGAARFDMELRSGQDVVFWTQVIADGSLSISPLPAASGATYFRHVRDGSISRSLTPDFATDRLNVIARLASIRDRKPVFGAVIASLQNAQGIHLGRYMRENPSARVDLLAEIARRDYRYFPYEHMNATAARTLVVSYAFPPYNDTSAMVMARRIHANGEPVDVISQNMSNIRGTDEVSKRLVFEHVGRLITVDGPATFTNWDGMLRYITEGYNAAVSRLSNGQYSHVYSRSMLPASHLLAALIKARHPSLRWTAEFSDPMRHDSNGNAREAELPESSVYSELSVAVTDAVPEAVLSHNLWEFIEDISFALADTILVTNDNQRAVMTRGAPPSLRERLERIVEVQRHPTLPAPFYSMTPSTYPLPSGRINLGYFGVFYPARGVGDVTSALRSLPNELRPRFMLHIFTDKPATVAELVERDGLEDCVQVNAYIPYLEFLNLTTQLDWLVVSDAHAAASHGGINPYLPSKYSDYAGSGTKIWGIVEPGSPLERMPLDASTRLGDHEGAETLLTNLAHSCVKSEGQSHSLERDAR